MLASGLPMCDWKSGAYEQARKVSNPRPSVLETAAPPLARVQRNNAHDGVRVDDEDSERMKERQLPANVGTAGIPGFPTSRLSLIE